MESRLQAESPECGSVSSSVCGRLWRRQREGNRGDWPLITLNLDLKSGEPEHLSAIWELLTQYRDWITSAPKTANLQRMEALDIRPVLVLTGESEGQKAVFYDRVPDGGRLLVFGAVETNTKNPSAAPDELAPHAADNYHRWWNNSWQAVEPEGQPKAGRLDDAKKRKTRSAGAARPSEQLVDTVLHFGWGDEGGAELQRVVSQLQFRLEGSGEETLGRCSKGRR